MENEQSISPSFKDKLKQSLCLSCCYRNNRRESLCSEDRPRLLRASSTWFRSRAHELPEIKDKCRLLISRIGRNHRRHHSSGEFNYDPLSYALNFDDAHLDEAPLRNFSSRFPASPPLKTVAEDLVNPAVPRPREITCV
ncbi:hypothetical protein LOK49_LG04G03012 [Camellia lanceoleosa]|uniref:Uncharacterized protein n=1 Tax=Camellia lanceoleosa TaxID=1840588 RepID=A0ACC0I0P2_9ERIC|nr:hypothetical protein LOK49_LG04G03012 [Camellia lanceoleosa]